MVYTDVGAAYVKAMGNPKERPDILACELVGTRVAEWIGLPMLDYGVFDISDDDTMAYPETDAPSPGPAFITKAIQAHTWGGTSEELQSISNPEVMTGLVVLDTWTLNRERYYFKAGDTKRNVRNVLLTGEGASKKLKLMIAMDHTHCFTYGKELNARTLRGIDTVKCSEVFGLFEEFKPYVSRQRLGPYITKLRGFDREAARAVTAGVPRLLGWTPEIDSAMREMLVERAQFLGDNLTEMLEATCHWDLVVG